MQIILFGNFSGCSEKAGSTIRVPEPVRTTPPSAKAAKPVPAPAPPIPAQTAATAPARNLTPALDSAIISDFPEIFAEFRGKRFSLLWRGGRDGFRARDFHRRCDGRANTLTLIEDTNGNIFGGFTPVKWESLDWRNCSKADPSLKSFLFTLKNPRNVLARRFALKAEMKDEAIDCWSDWGPSFRDLSVSDNGNTNTRSCTYDFGVSYTNDTGLDGKTVFTSSQYFQVKEIEVFEITD
jgi:hypothetical protein